jgi:hypothetical protein
LRFNRSKFVHGWLTGALGLGLLAFASPSAAQTGGAPAPGAPASKKPQRARLIRKSGRAIPPPGAPPAVVNAIAAGNAIHKRPYVWGGGHASFDSWGYDCSGAVSYVLGAAGLLESPLPSGPLMHWGEPGKGAWITVMSNRQHAYAVIAGLRWDTSSWGSKRKGSGGKGPRWRRVKRKPRGFAIRHYPGY